MPWYTPTSAMINVISRKPEKRYSASQKDGFFFPIYNSPHAVDMYMGPPPPYHRLYPTGMPQPLPISPDERRDFSPPMSQLPPPQQQKQLMGLPSSAPTPPTPLAPPQPIQERRSLSPPRHSVPPAPTPHVLLRRTTSIESLRPLEDVSPVASPRRTLSRRHTLTLAPSVLFEAGPGAVPAIAVVPPSNTTGARAVRFNDNPVCATPPPKRIGWYNRRGDQLWTNDGGYVEARPGQEFPKDLDSYPEPGEGWENEAGVRIDIRHRVVPKLPRRSALKPQAQRNNTFP